MLSASQLESLQSLLSSASSVLSDPSSLAFQERLRRWSNIRRQIPAAIVLPDTEDDCVQIIRWAITNAVPFVPKAGGMSLYSTTDDSGIVIDLTRLSAVEHDRIAHTANLVGAISSKEVAVELAKDSHCATLPASNPVGAIPFFINGGNSLLVSKVGYASDNIISARMISAKGELITVSDREHADLFYAIRGAGQYFGLVLSLTIRTFPVIEVLDHEKGSFWSGLFVFPLPRVAEVAKAMEDVVNDQLYCTGGLIMVSAPPPARQPAIIVSARLMHADANTAHETAFKKLYELKPVLAKGSSVQIENSADALQPLMGPGDYKKLRLTGIASYDPYTLPKIADVWVDLTAAYPDAVPSTFSIQWESRPAPRPASDSANGMHEVRFWANNLTWCTSAESQAAVQGHLERVIAITRENQSVHQYLDFANSLREPESPVERRYKGIERLERLRKLKREWDAHGIFGRELL